ncbi:MAG: hypothetical protein QE278_04640 [Limnobacter sp.]|nr:hypothetical protein [Limnobacter sp.]
MSLKNGQGIVPQVFALVLGLTGCASIQLQSPKPNAPDNLSAARQYMEVRSSQIDVLEAELNVQMRACYERFFVSDCVDAVRAKRAEYRRAHIEAESAANDIIRLDGYNARQSEKKPPKPENKKVF